MAGVPETAPPGRAAFLEEYMKHSLCIAYSPARDDMEDDIRHYCWITDLDDVWEFRYAEGTSSGCYHIPKNQGFAALLKECRFYFDETAWIYNDHANRR